MWGAAGAAAPPFLKEVFVSDYLTKEAAMAAIRCFFFIIGNRSLLKSLLTLARLSLLAAIFIAQPMSSFARDPSDRNAPLEKILSQLKERLKLTEEQETQLRPIIAENLQKRSMIEADSSQGGNTAKVKLQELQWSTDMKLGKVLTEDQMKEYEKLREEQDEKMRLEAMPLRGGRRDGAGRGFR